MALLPERERVTLQTSCGTERVRVMNVLLLLVSYYRIDKRLDLDLDRFCFYFIAIFNVPVNRTKSILLLKTKFFPLRNIPTHLDCCTIGVVGDWLFRLLTQSN